MNCNCESFATLAGIPDSAARYLTTVFCCYPIAMIYKYYKIYNLPKVYIHSYFILTGLLLCNYNFGADTLHSVITILITYIICKVLQKSKYLIVITFTFNMTYLLMGYYFTQTDKYDLIWTLPQCLLTLRLIGFSFDLYDGQKSNELLTHDQIYTHLKELPTITELYGYAYLSPSFFFGPQFPFNRYKKFVNNEFLSYKGNIEYSIKRFIPGFIYLIIYVYGTLHITDEKILTEEFHMLSITAKVLIICIWGKISMYKYVTFFLLSESVLILYGFTFVKTTVNDGVDWSGCSNVNIIRLEMATNLNDYVKSFNYSTNEWAAIYIYKRLKFMNNRIISRTLTLIFLAVWHGFHSGYYVAFFLEYCIYFMEEEIYSLYTEILLPHGYDYKKSVFTYFLFFVFLKMLHFVIIGYGFIPFVFLTYERWFHVYRELYFLTFFFFLISIAVVYKFIVFVMLYIIILRDFI